jgi:hypothetical protein
MSYYLCQVAIEEAFPMKTSNALKKQVVTQQEIESLIVQRETFSSLKKRLGSIEDSMKAIEAAIIGKIETGAEVYAPYDLLIRDKETRHPHWIIRRRSSVKPGYRFKARRRLSTSRAGEDFL